jgi:hypothetical protein
MNNLAYMGQDGNTVAPKVEELLRKELAGGPYPYSVDGSGAAGPSTKSVIADVASSVFGGSVTPLFAIHFDIQQPRPAQLDVHMLRQGLGCVAGSLAYMTVINKPAAGEVLLGDDGKFTGNAEVAGKLNAKKDVLKKCGDFAVQKGGLTGVELKIQRVLRITPQDRMSRIVAVTLPKSKSMGFSASLSSKEFLEMVALLESAL